jgi:hypothetical protein
MLAFSLRRVNQTSVYHGVIAREHCENDKVGADAFIGRKTLWNKAAKTLIVL